MEINESPPQNIELPVPPVAKETKKALKNFGPMVAEDYERFKIDLLKWLLTSGKDTYRKEGFAESTVKTTHYKIDESYRWLWTEDESYSKEFPTHRGTELLDTLMKNSPHPDSYVYTFEKSLRRLFKYLREQKNRQIPEWEHGIPIEPNRGSNKNQHIKDRFYPAEMNRLYEAALKEYSIKSYWNLDGDEREELKRLIASQQGIPMADIGPDEFEKASSWKYPSIVALSSDLGLRPIEVGKMEVDWLNLSHEQINIPAEGSTKSSRSWNCEISSESCNALENWMQERQSYDKYRDSRRLWLTKYGNKYNSRSLNRILDNLIEVAEINDENRTLSWYSFRHGAASIWTEKEGIAKAAEQIRHSSLSTTKQYLRMDSKSGVNHADDKW